MSDINEMELIVEVNLMAALGFYSIVSSIESLERMERARELVSSLKCRNESER